MAYGYCDAPLDYSHDKILQYLRKYSTQISIINTTIMGLNFFRANLRGVREIISVLGGYRELESLKQTSNIGSLNPDGEHEGRKQRLGLRSPARW
jgi:hypothetical protein